MKKFILIALATIFAAATMSAQDLQTATETYNNAAMELNSGNNEDALALFQQALQMAESLDESEEQAAIIENCKDIIPKVMFQIAKGYVQAKDFNTAIEKLNETAAISDLYGGTVAEEALALIPQVKLQKANSLLRDKNFEAAAAAYEEVVATDPENGRAYLSLGQSYNAVGNTDKAVEAFETAATLGQEKDANKQLSTIYIKKASAALKAKKYQEALDAALKSGSYLESGNAYKVAGNAASQLKKNAVAIENFEKYLAITPNAKDSSDIQFTIAALAQQMGDKAKAKEYFTKLLNDPKYAESASQQLKAL